MPTRNELVLEQLNELRQDLRDLWLAVAVDPKKQARKERAWTMLSGAIGALASMAARRAATKAWGVLTGESPPLARQAPTQNGAVTPPARREAEGQSAPTEETT
jgi:hypothetical protein